MMHKLLILFCCILLYSCEGKIKKEVGTPRLPGNKSVKIFAAIEKDSAFYVTYQFEKQANGNGSVVYNYNSDNGRHFSVIADTVHKKFELIENASDTSSFYIEDEKIFTVNGVNYRVFKLVSRKVVIDGEVSYFFNTDFGVLLKKSKTWRIGQVLNSEKNDTNYLPLTALLYNIFTKEGFYQNSEPPERKIKKFTAPKVE